MMRVDRRFVVAGLAVSVVPIGHPAGAASSHSLTLEVAPATAHLTGGAETTVWAYNGQVPGPLLRVRKGDELKVTLVNKLSQPTTLCWHGVRVANAMDGVAGLTQKPVMPGERFEYRFTPPDAGCFWYHPHAWPNSAEQIGRGLYGVVIVDEPEAPSVDDDVLVVLEDWVFDAQGRIKDGFLDPPDTPSGARNGSVLTVNGTPVPVPKTVRPGARIRLRLVNTSGTRIVVVGCVGLQTTVIAIDGQPSELFRPLRDAVPIGPGSRVELMLDVPTTASDAALVLLDDGAPDRKLVTFEIKGTALSPRGGVVKLPDNPLLPTRIALERSLKRQVPIARHAQPTASRDQAGKDNLGAAPTQATDAATQVVPMFLWSLDGKASDGFSQPPIFAVKRGSPVTLAFINTTDVVQQMHVHGHVFRVLHDLDDGWDPYWRESIIVAPGKTKLVAFVADNPGKWAVESSMLDRQVTGLAGYFTVT